MCPLEIPSTQEGRLRSLPGRARAAYRKHRADGLPHGKDELVQTYEA
jgi:hypothetical protein